jgi:hypothetical protein
MSHHERLPAPHRSLAALLAALLAGSLVAPARAADATTDTSLPLIPANAAFYGASLRNREQIEACAKSKAWARISALPLYKAAVKRLQQEYNEDEGKLAPLRKWMEQEANRDLVALLTEAVSDEIFFYGGDNWVGFIDLLQQLNATNRFGPALEAIRSRGENAQSGEARARMLLRVLAENRDKLKTPDLVIGFKIKDTRKAEAQVKRLETILQAVAMQQPLLQGRVKRAKVGDGSFLTVTLDGDMVPWEQVPWNMIEEKEGEFDDLLKTLRKLKLTLSLGVRNGYVLFSIGAGTDGLRQLGGEGPRLVSLPELKPLLGASGKRLTDIGYASKGVHGQATGGNDLSGMAELVKEVLDAAQVPPDKRKPIVKDVEDLVKEMKPHMPTPGPSVSFTYLTERGCESYVYDHTTYPDRDASQPLPLLQHVGGDPILAVIGRSKSKGGAEDYRRISKWVRSVFVHIEPLIQDKLDDEQKEKYDKVRKAVVPLLERFDEVTGTLLVPALADGQAGFVLDARWKSKQWHPALELGDKPLPMPELALVLGVSDAELLEKAMKSYRKILNDALQVAHEHGGEHVPELKLAPPEVKTVKSGKLFVFALPGDWKLDPQVAPTAGLSSRVAVVTLSAGHAERLLTPRPLVIEGGPLADAKRSLAGASYFSCPAFIDALTPWVVLAVEHWQEQLTEALANVSDDKKATEDLAGQVRTLLGALKVFHTTTSATTIEGGVVVTHSETVIRDK